MPGATIPGPPSSSGGLFTSCSPSDLLGPCAEMCSQKLWAQYGKYQTRDRSAAFRMFVELKCYATSRV